jgi:hypothetical protein
MLVASAFSADAVLIALRPFHLTEPNAVNKPRPARAIADLAQGLLAESFAKQGFASTELVTRWREIAGAEIAAHAEPVKIHWHRAGEGEPQEPGTLVLRVEGPTAIEIQHLAGVIIERVNRFFGWKAVGQIALRQAPLARQKAPSPPPQVDPELVERLAGTFSDVTDKDLRVALARLGAAVKTT